MHYFIVPIVLICKQTFMVNWPTVRTAVDYKILKTQSNVLMVNNSVILFCSLLV